MNKIIKIFVGGSINQDISNTYKIFAEELGNIISERDYRIVFDGCSGLPAIVFENLKGYDRAIIYYTEQYRTKYIKEFYSQNRDYRIYRVLEFENQSKMTDGIIDLSKEFYSQNRDYRIYRVLEFENQSKMTDGIIDLSDALIFMKGHMGTLEEVFRAINGKKNNEHDKPIVIININHEWDDLINILSSCNVSEYYYVTDNVIDCLNFIELELYKESSYFYKNYVINKYIDRINPIVEGNIIKKGIK